MMVLVMVMLMVMVMVMMIIVSKSYTVLYIGMSLLSVLYDRAAHAV